MQKRGVGCPMPLAHIFLGERFGKWPWELEDQPADKVQFYMNVIGAYNEAQADMRGLKEHQPMYWFEDE